MDLCETEACLSSEVYLGLERAPTIPASAIVGGRARQRWHVMKVTNTSHPYQPFTNILAHVSYDSYSLSKLHCHVSLTGWLPPYIFIYPSNFLSSLPFFSFFLSMCISPLPPYTISLSLSVARPLSLLKKVSKRVMFFPC